MSAGNEGLGFDDRSPWSNEYLPVSTSGPAPSAKLRQLEVSLNGAFDTYREMYFEGGISSVYLWDLDDDTSGGKEMAFAGAVVLKKGKCISRLSILSNPSLNAVTFYIQSCRRQQHLL